MSWSAYGPVPAEAALAGQVTFLDQAVDGGADAAMQRLFPEGYFFTHALTGMAQARSGQDLDSAREHLTVLDSPEAVDRFGSGLLPEHGIFQAGWALALAIDLHEAQPSAASAAEVTARAEIVAAALDSSSSWFLEGYPGQYWPCDTVVAASALARSAVALDRADWLSIVGAWRERAEQHLDPATGLWPHEVDSRGAALQGRRGSSQAIIHTFLPDIEVALDGEADWARWLRFTEAFVVREVGLVGVREYPLQGTGGAAGGPGDVDSGPLIAGISLSASAVTLAAAQRMGDADLAEALTREAELLGAPLAWGNTRRYALGQVPVGDAFLAFARSTPPITPNLEGSADPPTESPTPRPRWELLLALAVLPGAAGAALAAPDWRHDRRRTRRRTHPPIAH